jgi:hypothetical protein
MSFWENGDECIVAVDGREMVWGFRILGAGDTVADAKREAIDWLLIHCKVRDVDEAETVAADTLRYYRTCAHFVNASWFRQRCSLCGYMAREE